MNKPMKEELQKAVENSEKLVDFGHKYIAMKNQLAAQAKIIEECEKALDKIYRIPCHNPETCQSCLAKEAIVSLKAHKEKYNG